MITRLGQFSFRHRWWVLGIWMVLMAGGSAAIGPLFDKAGNTEQLGGTEVGRAAAAIDAGLDHGVAYTVLVDHIDAKSAAATSALQRAVQETAAVPGVQEVSEPDTATDGGAAAITVTLAKSDHQFQPFTDSKARMGQLNDQLPGARVQFGGGDLVSDQANAEIHQDLNRSEAISLPITLLVLIFIFGGVIVAGLPVLAAIGTVLTAGGILLGFASLVDLDTNAVTVLAILSLGLSIDYALLLVARYREELVVSEDRGEALRRAWSTAGRTVAFSALTIAAALTGLLSFQIGRLQGLALAGITTAVVAMLASLTLTAALLGLFGKRIRPRARSGTKPLESGFFARLARRTQRRPLLLALGCAAVLLALAAPLLHLAIKDPQLEGLPRSIEAVQVADQLGTRFGQTTQPAVRVVARTDPATLDSYASRWSTDPEVARVEKSKQDTADLSSVVLAVRGDGQSKDARDLVGRLRADRPSGYESWVTGDAARLIDIDNRLMDGLPLAIGITVGAMLVLLFLMTGSLVIPVKAMVLNLLSLGATFGVLVAVFQDGWFAGPLHTITVGGLSPFMIVIVFAFAFGFSMDYEVFILSRIKEHVDAGEDSDTAVRHGLQRSGWIVTAAALLMLIVYAVFAGAKMGQIEQIGLGLLVAVLLDATIVRCLLLPATMTLLGRAAWWAPGPLRRFHTRRGPHEIPVVAQEEPQPVH